MVKKPYRLQFITTVDCEVENDMEAWELMCFYVKEVQTKIHPMRISMSKVIEQEHN